MDLRPQDLASVRSYFHHTNRQWILGDTVDVVASTEFFSQILSLNVNMRTCVRHEERVGRDALITVRYVGAPGRASVMTNPRVMIGTGLTISARQVLRLRLVKTHDSLTPVSLRVTAQGRAAKGRGDEVDARGDILQIRGALRYSPQARSWSWTAH